MLDKKTIKDMADKANDRVNEIEEGIVSGNFGMTYEQGVLEALLWVLQNTEAEPIEEL